jgi:hypothetical protein
MAYIGTKPTIGNFQICDAISVVNGQAAYTMQVGSVNVIPQSANHMIVSLNGVIQKPGSSFTVSGSTITFASNLATGDVIDFIQILGDVLDLGTPSDATVTTAKLADSAVTAAKITDATITAAKITDSTITAAKLASGVVQNQSAFKNIIINGDMSVAQRGTSSSGITSDGYYTVDRFLVENGSFGTWTQSQAADAPTGQGYYNSLKMDCTTAQGSPSSNSILLVGQSIEGFMLQPIKQGTANAESTTLSFWHKHTKTGTNIVELLDADNSNAVSGSYTQSVSDTWEKATITFPANTSGTYDNDNARSLRIRFIMGAGTDYTSGTLATTWQTSITNANRYAGQVNNADSTSNNFIITGVQYEVGTSASDFEFLPFDVNQIRCLRYYQILDVGSNCPLYTTGDGNHNRHLRLTWGVRKRAAPSCSSSATSGTLSSLGETHDSKSFFVNVGSGSGTTGLNANVTIDAEL